MVTRLCLMFLLMIGLALAPPVGAETTVLHVSTAGTDDWVSTDDNPCTAKYAPCRTLKHAVGQAPADAEIRIASGQYFEHGISIGDDFTALLIGGGWDSVFSSQELDPTLTALSASGVSGIFSIEVVGTTLSVTIENLMLREGERAYGGALSIEARGGTADLSVTLNDVRIYNHLAIDGGGAIYARSACCDNSLTLTISKAWFDNNEAEDADTQSGGVDAAKGGAISAKAEGNSRFELSLSDSTVQRNSAAYAGGAIHLSSPGGGDMASTVEASFMRNVIQGNSVAAEQIGGAVYANATHDSSLDLSFDNNIIVDNQAGQGGGLYVSSFDGGDVSLTLRNNTISDNDEGGFYAYESPDASIDISLLNTILWGNEFYDMWGGEGVTISMAHCDTTLPAGSADITYSGFMFNGDPLFKYPQPVGDYHLTADSPAVDTGICGEGEGSEYIRLAPLDDFEGDPRPGAMELTGCDIGADEYALPEPSQWLLQGAAMGALALFARRRAVRSR